MSTQDAMQPSLAKCWLQDCKGRPEEELTAILRQTADNVLVEYGKLT